MMSVCILRRVLIHEPYTVLNMIVCVSVVSQRLQCLCQSTLKLNCNM